MPRGGSRPGAGRPNGSVITEEKKLQNAVQIITSEAAIERARSKGVQIVDELYEMIQGESSLTDSEYEFELESLNYALDSAVNLAEGVQQLAKEAEHPRMHEVAINTVKEVSNIAKDIMKLKTEGKKDRINRLQRLAETVLSYSKEKQVPQVNIQNNGVEFVRVNMESK